MKCRAKRISEALFLGVPFLLWPGLTKAGTPAAQTGELFNRAPETDWALSWLAAIFRGAALPQGLADGAVHLPALTAALREALSVYSLGMLIIAGFLLAYHVTVMVAETARTGVVMGGHTNRFWAPLRFVLAIGLLVPVGGGLNSGQYIVVKLAEAGSSLASNAWQGAAATIKDSLNAFVSPYRPDATRLTAVAAEMEICRSLYRQLFAAGMNDPAITRAGDIYNLQKIPAGKLAPEAWRYTNTLHASLPLCGEYRFISGAGAAANDAGQDETTLYPGDLAAFARADAERLSIQTRLLAERLAPSFLPTASGAPAADISGALAGLIQEQRKTLDATLRAMAASKAPLVSQALDESAAAGWITAGFFVGNIARRQSVFGALASGAIPSAHAPLFGHKVMDHAALSDAAATDPVLRLAPQAQLDKAYALYDQMNAAMKKARGWLYGKAMPDAELMLADTLDVRDQTGPANDADTGAFMFARLLKAAAVTYGVWAESPRTGTNSRSATTLAQDMTGNPIAGMAELGRRYAALGHYLLAMTGPAFFEPNVLGSVLLFALAGFLFSIAGMAMMFVMPLLPLLRFFLGVLVWLLAVFEAVAALPLVALAHLTPAGEGLSGPLARRAYWLWLGVFMRPLLTLFGFVVGFVLLTFALAFLNAIFEPLLMPLTVTPGDSLLPVWAGFALLYAVLALAMANAAFKSIHWLPARILNWLGGWGLSDTAGTATAPATQAVQMAPPGAALFSSHSSAIGQGAGPDAETTGTSGTPSSSTQSSHGLKAALIPAYRDPPVEPVVIGSREETAVGMQTGGEGVSIRSGAAAGAPGATAVASATATAHATVMAPSLSLPEKPTPADIQRALDRLSSKVDKMDKRALPPRTGDSPSSGKPAKKSSEKADESPEQSSAPPESDKPA